MQRTSVGCCRRDRWTHGSQVSPSKKCASCVVPLARCGGACRSCQAARSCESMIELDYINPHGICSTAMPSHSACAVQCNLCCTGEWPCPCTGLCGQLHSSNECKGVCNNHSPVYVGRECSESHCPCGPSRNCHEVRRETNISRYTCIYV